MRTLGESERRAIAKIQARERMKAFAVLVERGNGNVGLHMVEKCDFDGGVGQQICESLNGLRTVPGSHDDAGFEECHR